MKKRLLCIGVAILLLCTSLTACAPQQEEVSELDLIKAEWQRYVVDRTGKIYSACASAPWNSSYASWVIEDQAVIKEVLDICQTLNVAEITIPDEHPESMLQSSLNVWLGIKELPDTDGNGIYILLFENDEAYLRFVTGDIERWAYVSGWPVYEQLEEYRYYVPTQETSALDLIKTEWKRYFVDRTKEVKYIGIHPNMASSFYGFISEQPELNAMLDICKTLDTNLLQTEKPWTQEQDPFASSMSINFEMDETFDIDSTSADDISIRISPDGKTSLLITINGTLYRAYVEKWDAYESFSEYCYISQASDSTDE